MPKKKKQETQEEQSERFRAAVRQMIADGELNPTDADRAFERAMGLVSKQSSPPSDGGGS